MTDMTAYPIFPVSRAHAYTSNKGRAVIPVMAPRIATIARSSRCIFGEPL
jgi:hypothetical protein